METGVYAFEDLDIATLEQYSIDGCGDDTICPVVTARPTNPTTILGLGYSAEQDRAGWLLQRAADALMGG